MNSGAQPLTLAGIGGYREGMSESSPEPTQPSNADLLAFMQSAFAHLATEISGVKADVAGVNVELRAGLDGLREEIHGDIRASEARLASRIDAVQQVVRSVKSDIAAHVDDRDTHHRHAA